MTPELVALAKELGPTLAAALVFLYVFWKSASNDNDPISADIKLWLIQNIKEPLLDEIRSLHTTDDK